ncbi:hypothetical protein H632_c4551p0, partial [Helicosporidium sp. ATCC 50920]
MQYVSSFPAVASLDYGTRSTAPSLRDGDLAIAVQCTRRSLRSLDLRGAQRLSAQGFSALSYASGLRRLALDGSSLCDDALQSLRGLSSLEHLSARSCLRLSGYGLSALRHAGLRSLDLAGCGLSLREPGGAALAALGTLSSLEALDLSSNGALDGPTAARA